MRARIVTTTFLLPTTAYASDGSWTESPLFYTGIIASLFAFNAVLGTWKLVSASRKRVMLHKRLLKLPGEGR